MGLNMNENWFEIVEILRNTLDSNYSKAEFVSAVENCFRVLGWRKTNGSLIKNYNLPNGSNVDIVLSKTYGGNVQSDYIPVFIQCGEFQYNETDNVNFAMDELLTEAAISFGSCIKFFYRNNQDIILSKEILLEESNHEGIQISDLLLFQHFKKSLVHDYITSLNEKNEVLSKLRLDIKRISEDRNILKSIFSDFLVQLGYDKALIEEEMRNFEIVVSQKQLCSKEMENHSASTKDTTRFSFNGSQFYPKKRFVLAVVKQYVKEHPGITYNELERVFPSGIISKQRGVIRPLSVVQEWMKDNADLSSRYFLESDELITLNDGLQYTVYNQWGLKQFNKFLEIAQSMYIVNSDKKNNDVKEDITEHSHKSVLQISKESLQSFVKKKC